jgi:hypothetical protein
MFSKSECKSQDCNLWQPFLRNYEFRIAFQVEQVWVGLSCIVWEIGGATSTRSRINKCLSRADTPWKTMKKIESKAWWMIEMRPETRLQLRRLSLLIECQGLLESHPVESGHFALLIEELRNNDVIGSTSAKHPHKIICLNLIPWKKHMVRTLRYWLSQCVDLLKLLLYSLGIIRHISQSCKSTTVF